MTSNAVSSTDPSGRGSSQGRYVGPAILLAVVATFAVIAVLALTGREQVVRPELGEVPIPEGAVVRYMDGRCPSPEERATTVTRPDETTICDTVLALSPMEGLWLPGSTEEALVEHLEASGWHEDRGWMTSPHGLLLVRVEGFEELRERDARLASEIEAGSSRVNEPDRLAVLTVLPGS